MGRPFACRQCGRVGEAATSTGPLPSVCDDCDPVAAERRRRGREQACRRGDQVRVLRARVAELEAALRFDREADAAVRGEEPGRAAVGRAVRRLARAQGRQETRQALLRVAGACRAWARAITAHGEDLP